MTYKGREKGEGATKVAPSQRENCRYQVYSANAEVKATSYDSRSVVNSEEKGALYLLSSINFAGFKMPSPSCMQTGRAVVILRDVTHVLLAPARHLDFCPLIILDPRLDLASSKHRHDHGYTRNLSRGPT